MNAIALELPSKKIVDPFGGKEDIKKRLIRAVGNARERFAEDGLRPLRALRFVSQLGFELERETFEAIRPALPVTAKVSAERLRDETEKTVMGAFPVAAFLLMEQSGLMEFLLPELARCRGIAQRGLHRFDVLDHSLYACGWAARNGRSLELRLAALFHDLGKAETRGVNEYGAVTFYRHEAHSARIAGEILRRLRWPGAVTEKVCHLIGQHMFHYTPDWNGAAVRRFIVRAGAEHLRDLYDLRRADVFAIAGDETPPAGLAELEARVEAERERRSALSLKDLAVNGDDLMGLGMEKGKRIGVMLGRLFDAVLEDPALNTRERLLEIAGNMMRAETGR